MHAPRSNNPSTSQERVAQGTKEAHAKLLREVLASRTFAKSARLSELLGFICRTTLDGAASQLNEQQIGIRVFGRSPSYNPAEDSIVRAQARLLRQKLEEYFDHECPHTPEVITVPKGGYVPVFRPRELLRSAETALQPEVEGPASAGNTASADVAIPNVSAAGRDLFSQIPWRSVLGFLLILAAISVWGVQRRGRTAPSTEAVDLLWNSIFQKDQATLIVPSDDGLVLFQELTHSSVDLDDYIDGSYLRRITPSSNGGVTFSPQWFAAHQYTSSADLNLTLRLSRIRQASLAQMTASNARGLRLDDLKSRNVVLIGGPGSNPWVGLFADRLNFQLGWDWNTGEGFVRNSRPEQKELAVYRDVLLSSSRKSYGLLAYLPGIDRTKQALLVEGTGMAGTEAAADFLFGSSFKPFAQSIGATRDYLPYFELLLETSSIGGNGPEARIVAYRVIRP